MSFDIGKNVIDFMLLSTPIILFGCWLVYDKYYGEPKEKSKKDKDLND